MSKNSQIDICLKYDVKYVEAPDHLKVGISKNVKSRLMPINGLRHLPEGDTTGWYIWAGENFSEEPRFFEPLHVTHLETWCPLVLKYLGLPPGSRFLITDTGYEDVWFDESLL